MTAYADPRLWQAHSQETPSLSTVAGILIGGGPRAFQKCESGDLLPSRALSTASLLLDHAPESLSVLKEHHKAALPILPLSFSHVPFNYMTGSDHPAYLDIIGKRACEAPLSIYRHESGDGLVIDPCV